MDAVPPEGTILCGASRVTRGDARPGVPPPGGPQARGPKDLARACLEHSFLPGRGLWNRDLRTGYRPTGACARGVQGAEHPSERCARFLKAGPKAQVERRQEAAFQRFETHHARATRPGSH